MVNWTICVCVPSCIRLYPSCIVDLDLFWEQIKIFFSENARLLTYKVKKIFRVEIYRIYLKRPWICYLWKWKFKNNKMKKLKIVKKINIIFVKKWNQNFRKEWKCQKFGESKKNTSKVYHFRLGVFNNFIRKFIQKSKFSKQK